MSPTTAESEPTTTFVPDVRPAPLFELLTVTGDYTVYTTAAQQMQDLEPDAVLVGEVLSAVANPADPVEPVPGALNTVLLTVQPHRLAGVVPTQEDGPVVVEVYRPPLVTAEWIVQSYGLGGDTLFVLENVGDPAVATVTHPMSLYRTSADGGLELPSAPEFPAPQDLEALDPASAFEVLAPHLR